jgi:hypothetical protein
MTTATMDFVTDQQCWTVCLAHGLLMVASQRVVLCIEQDVERNDGFQKKELQTTKTSLQSCLAIVQRQIQKQLKTQYRCECR